MYFCLTEITFNGVFDFSTYVKIGHADDLRALKGYFINFITLELSFSCIITLSMLTSIFELQKMFNFESSCIKAVKLLRKYLY